VAVGVRSRRRVPSAVQEPLFEVRLQPERRYYRQILQALSRSSFQVDPLLAEITVGKVLGVIWVNDPRREGSAEEAFGLGLVEYAGQSRTPTAVALLRTLGGIATLREVRDAAALAAEQLVRAGLPPAPVEAPLRGRCWAYEDSFGDVTSVLCEFGYGRTLKTADRHGLLIQIDHVAFSAATDARLVDDVDAAVQNLQYGAGHETHTLRLVEPGWAGAVLGRAFARTDLIPSVLVEPTFAETRALAMARVRSLPVNDLPAEPEPTTERRAAVVAEFLSSPFAPVGASEVSQLIVEFAATHDPGDLAKVSPGRWEAFLFDWLPRYPALSSSPDAVAEVVRAWSRWATRTSSLTEAAREHLARLLDELLEEYLASASPAPSSR
jgi:hypothetical protein